MNHLIRMCVRVYVYAACACSDSRNEKAWGALKLELQVFVSHYVDAENGTWVFCRSTKCS